MRRSVLLFCAAALAITPAAAQRAHYLDPRDVAEAQKENAQIVEELGGTETGPRAAYVESVGRRVGAYSGVANAGQALHFTTLNSAVENAFSVPGGYVYITRQLMGIMGDESQLAFALGHEVGHIAANHAHQREEYAAQNPLGVLGRILGAVFGDRFMGSILQVRAKLQQLSFSREQEYEADTLGLRYMIAAGYDPAGAAQLLSALSRTTALEARVQGRTNRQTPEWASTHPLSENRMQRALQEARATGRLGTGLHNRDVFLNQLEGVYVDDDPAQGVIDGPVFTHPDLRIQFRVPTGYLMSNGTFAVTVSGSAGKAQFSGGRYNGSLDNYILRVFEQLTRGQVELAIPQPRRTTINGMPAAYTTAHVRTDSGLIDVSVMAYQWDPQHIYHFVMLTQGGTGIGPFTPMVNSLRRITQAEAAAIRPRIIHVVTVKPGDTLQSLASRMAYRDFKLDRFLVMNGLTANSRLAPGQRVKLVIYGARRS
ncbi:M48 family metalloprotease [Sphingomonas sp.]|uniref:M48 family metalloprotease n=1 Tax=Sphingomonas sp. TaxID=28214 RepID=UPI002DBF243E|nr:M48 family metalloprotease [Sphingomonas sp.]HEU4969215.1 M48 family metalloprotease [Sphingomonas sp.]